MPSQPTRPHLDTLAYRCTPTLLDGATVYLREFPKGVTSMWTLLDKQYKDMISREEAQAPHSVLTSALRCLTGGYVQFDPKQGFLATRHRVDDDTLRDAFTLMHGLILGRDIDDIDLNRPSPLAERVAETPQDERLLADYLTVSPGRQPDAPNWVYRTVAWDLSQRLARTTWSVDGRQIIFRSDSNGGLVAWDQPWTNKSKTAHALARIRLTMKTLPNLTDPLILVSAQSTRVASRMAYTRTVLAEQADPALPLVEVEMAGRGRVRRVHRMALQTLGRLGMDHSVLHGVQQRVDAEQEAEAAAAAAERGSGNPQPPVRGPVELGSVRPLHSKNFSFPIGRGVGMHHLRELHRHFGDVLGADSPRIVQDARARGFKQLAQAELAVKPDDIVRSLDAMGYAHLRIVCLWFRDENRTRMLHGLAGVFGLDPQALDPAEGIPVPLDGGHVSAVFHQVPTFLAHSPASGRIEDIEHVTSLKAQPGTLVGVWAETEFAAGSDEEEPEPGTTDDSQTSTGRPAPDEDAKYRARRTLAALGAVSQFTGDRKIPRKKKKDSDKPAADHQVISSLLDLCRSLGIIDRRIDQVMVDAHGPYKPGQIAHCGIHVRRQSRQGKDRTAKICITASVLVPPAAEGGAWTLHGWSYTDRTWRPYHQAQAAFHAEPYPTGKMTEFDDDNQGYKKVAALLDQSLLDLADFLGGTPYTVTVDAVGVRRLWMGLHNRRRGQPSQPGTTWLPGSTLAPRDRPLAVIRINKDMDEVPRPVQVSHLDEEGTAVRTNKVTNLLYQVEPDLGTPTWLLATVPNQFDGAGAGRLGEDKTRWSADPGSSDPKDRRKNEVRAPWYTMTATEIYPIIAATSAGLETAPIEPQSLALMAARLCHQPLAWANRTRYPVPLHAAQQMDLDHPQYRRTAVPADQDANETGERSINSSPVEEPEN
jgi:hypothetical protein